MRNTLFYCSEPSHTPIPMLLLDCNTRRPQLYKESLPTDLPNVVKVHHSLLIPALYLTSLLLALVIYPDIFMKIWSRLADLVEPPHI